ncbi:MAG TPA: lipopolysaccharide heptosyltransferase II [Planctomycetota bacterium]|nr:lipopolysaccharide heptosyltransferase II [Planctomycetota bacterium]
MSPPEARNILIRAPNWVGDLVMATSSFADIRRTFPSARITVLLPPGRDRVIDGSPDHDRIILDRAGNSPLGLWRLSRELRAERFDLAIIFPNSFRAALIAFLAGIPRRVGYRRDLRSALLSDRVEYEREGRRRRPVPMPLFYAKLCERVGVTPGDGRPRLHVTQEVEEKAEAYRRALGIAPGEPLVGLNPGASFGASKLWPPAHFAELGDAITERHGLRTLLLFGPGEEAIAGDIASRMRHPPIFDPSRLVRLDVLKPLIRDLKLLVTTDTGPRQYAVAFGVPVVVVMGPTDPRYSGINLERTEVVRHDVPCGPCHLKVCPIDHRCMTGITPAEVLGRIEELDRRTGRIELVNREWGTGNRE